jgi:hypothetical protein
VSLSGSRKGASGANRVDPMRVVDDSGRTVSVATPAVAADTFRVASPAIEFDGWLPALVYEALGDESSKDRVDHHRFVWLDQAGALRGVSRPFFLRERGIERAAGLAWRPDGKRLVLSYTVGGGEAWIATIEAGEARACLPTQSACRRSGRCPARAHPYPMGRRPKLRVAPAPTETFKRPT